MRERAYVLDVLGLDVLVLRGSVLWLGEEWVEVDTPFLGKCTLRHFLTGRTDVKDGLDIGHVRVLERDGAFKYDVRGKGVIGNYKTQKEAQDAAEQAVLAMVGHEQAG